MDYKEKVIALLNSQELTKEQKEKLENIFPELKEKESEDERIRKELIAIYSVGAKVNAKTGDIPDRDIVAWLEKQGEKQPVNFTDIDIKTWKYVVDAVLTEKDGIGQYLDSAVTERIAKKLQKRFSNFKEQTKSDKTTSKFKVGDWIVINETAYQITEIDDSHVVLSFNERECNFGLEVLNNAHLWTINDAKDGDVLTNGESIVIFKQIVEPKYRQYIEAYIGLDWGCNIQVTSESWSLGIDKTMPATKEQRELLFQKIKEAGYEWDREKKELKKIEAKTLDADKVIEWLNDQACLGWIEDVEVEKFVEQLKEDFGLC